MEIAEAQRCVSRERARWLPFAGRLSNDELLRHREHLFNGLTMVLALAILPTWLFGGALGTVGVLLVIGGEVFAARHYSNMGNQCRDARELLEGQPHEPSA